MVINQLMKGHRYCIHNTNHNMNGCFTGRSTRRATFLESRVIRLLSPLDGRKWVPNPKRVCLSYLPIKLISVTR